MSRDSSHHHLHLIQSYHADLFEEFTRPPSTTTNPTQPTTTEPPQQPSTFLPHEEILLPPELMPLNPEDEDGVVPDMHAAWGINAALGQGGGQGRVMNGTVTGMSGAGQGVTGTGERSTAGLAREGTWRDLGMEQILDGGEREGRGAFGVNGGDKTMGARREGRRTGVLLLR
jgi:hypothetical protein